MLKIVVNTLNTEKTYFEDDSEMLDQITESINEMKPFSVADNQYGLVLIVPENCAFVSVCEE